METRASVCPHDCPSACPVDVDVRPDGTVARLHGARQPYAQGVVCAKVARYGERVHHPNRIMNPLRRLGAKGEGRFAPISWDEALDEIVHNFEKTAKAHGPQAVWPYFYAGTMGLVQMGATNRLRRAMGYSGQTKTICAAVAGAGWAAGIGAKWGVDIREAVHSDLLVVWGADPAATQVHIMGLAAQAKKARGAKLVVIDPCRTPTAEKADLHLMLRPGTDGALACAVMHVLFRDGFADQEYMDRYTQDGDRLREHAAARGPQWAAPITGLDISEIEAFAQLYGQTKRSLIRLGYGMTRSRNGAVNLHAASCLPAITGAWAFLGGGATQSMSGVFNNLDRTLLDAQDIPEPPVRQLDMSRIGAILTGDCDALQGGPPVKAVLMQNTNPAVVAPDSSVVQQGLARDDLFLAVHEQVMTRTAHFADIVLPATSFLEHADLYTSYGHTYLQAARPVIAPIGEARSNHRVICDLAERLGAEHASFALGEEELIEDALSRSGLPDLAHLIEQRMLDCGFGFDRTHFLNGFGHDGGFRFAPLWGVPGMPALPDHWAVVEAADLEHPFRLITPPSRHFLNSTFSETETSRRLAERPTALIHTADAQSLGIETGAAIRLSNRRGAIIVHARATDGIARGTIAVHGLWSDDDFIGGIGINCLTGADAVSPAGGAAFHDSAIRVEPALLGDQA